MKSVRLLLIAAATLGVVALAASSASAENTGIGFSVMGGVQALNKNKATFPDHIIDVPVAAALSFDLSPVWALEGNFSWVIPVKQDIDLGGGFVRKGKSPDMLSYQGNLKANLSTSSSIRPYVTAGAGAVTLLSTKKADRIPQLASDQTAFAANAGIGAEYAISGPLALRLDLRELAAFPSKGQDGFTDSSGKTKDLWMESGTLGISYHF